MYIQLIHAKKKKKKTTTHRCPLTQRTRAHYCRQIFALVLAAFVYPAALSTETEFGREWKRTKRGSATNSISSKATSLHFATGAWHPPWRRHSFQKLFQAAPRFDKQDAATQLYCQTWKNRQRMKLWFLFSTILCYTCGIVDIFYMSTMPQYQRILKQNTNNHIQHIWSEVSAVALFASVVVSTRLMPPSSKSLF